MATILIVDDRPLNRQFLTTLLGYVGHRCIEAADGIEALEAMRRELPDLVISDILMPRMDGIEFAGVVHADPLLNQVPVMFYTATYRVHDARELGKSCGVTRVLAKPSDPQLILDEVNDALGSQAPVETPAEALGAERPRAVSAALTAGQGDLTRLQLHMQRAIDQGLALVSEYGALRMAAHDLASVFGTVQDLSLRLMSLLELDLELGIEHDPQLLVEMCCRASQDILNSRYAGIGLLDGSGRLMFRASRGLPEQAVAALARMDSSEGVLGAVLQWSKPCRASEITEPVAEGLPAGHPPVRHLLAVPVMSAQRCHGWLYVADKLGDTPFSSEDEEFATAVARQLALAYDNLLLYEAATRHAAELEAEMRGRELAEREVRESETRFRQLAGNLREALFLIDPKDTQTYYVSPAFEEIWQQPCQTLYERADAWMDAIHPDDHERVARSNASRDATGRIDVEYRIVRGDGSTRWIASRGFPILNEVGAITRIAGIAEDISERKAQEQRIARLNRIQAVLSGINSAIVRIRDRQGLFDEACRIAVEHGQFGIAWIGLVDKLTLAVKPLTGRGIDPGTLSRLGLNTPLQAEGGGPGQALAAGEIVIFHDMDLALDLGLLQGEALAGSYQSVAALPLLVEGAPIGVLMLYAKDAGGFDHEEMRLLGELAGDISFGLEHIEKEERLRYLSYYDALTGLPNSTLFQDRVNQMMQLMGQANGGVAVIALDLDRFTSLNDTLGRHVGDALLKHVAVCLSGSVPEPCSLARIGADTFAVAVAGLADGAAAATLLRERLQPALARPASVHGHAVRMSAHAGIALYPGDGDDAASLFKNAEAALKRARELGEDCLYYRPEINASIAHQLTLERELRSALEQQQFVVHYQPKLELRTGRIVGAEALIRWQHREHGMVSPATFIPLAEETGLIVPMGEWVLGTVCAQQAVWQVARVDIVPVAVNLSAMQCRRGGVQDLVRQVLAEHELEPQYLELELTESAVIHDPVEAERLLTGLRQLGVGLALDDFGTGYSSLAHLKRFPFNLVKIDRAFITDITRNADDAAIARTIIAMAHQLNMKVLAEGVETEGQLRYLRDYGCDQMQGFYFSRPVPAAEFEAMLREGRRLALPMTGQ